MRIRPIKAADVDVVALMMVEFDRHFAVMEGRRGTLKLAKTRAELARAGLGRGTFCMGLIAEDKDDACGYLLYHFGFNSNVRRRSLFVSDLYVRSKWRRGKVGLALMERARAIALKCGCGQMDWTVWNMNPPAIAFYLSLGGKSVDDEIVMGLKIGR
jgi:GNAT superfamily N-acetyltransferase